MTEYWDGDGWRLTDSQTGRSNLTRNDFQDGATAWIACRAGASSASYGNGELWGGDELRGTLVNDVTALNKVEICGWYLCDRLKVEPLDRPHEELDTSLDDLARLAAAALRGAPGQTDGRQPGAWLAAIGTGQRPQAVRPWTSSWERPVGLPEAHAAVAPDSPQPELQQLYR